MPKTKEVVAFPIKAIKQKSITIDSMEVVGNEIHESVLVENVSQSTVRKVEWCFWNKDEAKGS